MKPVRWSARILTDLAMLMPLATSGCAATTGPAPEAAPPPGAPTIAAPPPVKVATGPAADPPGTPLGITDLAELVKADRVDQPLSGDHVQTLAYGKGLFSYYAAAQPDRGEVQSCPFADADSACRFFRLAPWKSPRSLADAFQAVAAADVGTWGKIEPAKHDWSAFSPGKDRVYAVRRDHQLAIDVIDDRGAVSMLAEAAPTVGALHDVHVVETSSGLVVVAENESEDLVVTSLKIDASGKPVGTFGAMATLNVKGAPAWATARWVRAQVDTKKRVAWGEWSAVPVAGGVAIAFVDVSPPAKGTPRGVAKEPMGARHGCGRPSRPLSDGSVDKTVRAMLIDARGVVTKEVVVAPLGGIAKAPKLDLAPRPDGGFSLLGKGYGKELNELGAVATSAPAEGPKPAFASAPLQTVEAIGFDAASGEGLMMAREGDALVARTFDALGKPTGDARRFPAADDAPPAHIPSLARVGDTWLFLEEDADTVMFVTGPHAGKRLEVPELSRLVANQTLGIFAWGDGRAVVVRASNRHEVEPRDKSAARKFRQAYDPRPSGLLMSVIDVAKGTIEQPLSPVEGWPRREGEVPKMTSAIAAQTGPKGLLVAGFASSPTGETTPIAFRRASPSSPWEEVTLPKMDYVHGVETVVVDGDIVALYSSHRERIAVWTGSGESRAPSAGAARVKVEHARGPVISSGALPRVAGEVLPVAQLEKLDGCPTAVMTGPSRVVFACAGHVAGEGASLRAGLRTLRY